MIDYSKIELRPALDDDYEFSYQVKKEAEGEYIAAYWPWDEAVQRNYFDREWSEIQRDIILYDGKTIGTIAVTDNDEGILIRQFFILPEFHNKGIGSNLLNGILKKADESGKTARLKFLKNNPARSLYERHGFCVTGEEERFYSAERMPAAEEVLTDS